VERLEGERPHNATLKSGDFFGDEVLLDQKDYGATVVALQTTACWRIDRTTLKQSVGSLKARKRAANNIA
jgi:CRP-like cAMP-binding protein